MMQYFGGELMTRVTARGQVTIPKRVRDAVGIKPGDVVEVRATASGTVIVEKPATGSDYRKRLYALAKRRLIGGVTTEELMHMTRGNPALDPPAKKK
jgi:AbrB family looped-hinge helix DNA binding protein